MSKITVSTTPKNRITLTTGGGFGGGVGLADITPIWYHANGAANVANWAYNSVNSNWQ